MAVTFRAASGDLSCSPSGTRSGRTYASAPRHRYLRAGRGYAYYEEHVACPPAWVSSPRPSPLPRTAASQRRNPSCLWLVAGGSRGRIFFPTSDRGGVVGRADGSLPARFWHPHTRCARPSASELGPQVLPKNIHPAIDVRSGARFWQRLP